MAANGSILTGSPLNRKKNKKKKQLKVLLNQKICYFFYKLVSIHFSVFPFNLSK